MTHDAGRHRAADGSRQNGGTMKPLCRLCLLVAIPSAVAGAAGLAQAATCDELRAEIEARIAAAGVARFTVAVADAAAPLAPGAKVVGSCDRGGKSIVYEVQSDGAATGATGPSAAAGRPPASRAAPILTECRDGTQSVGGDCRN